MKALIESGSNASWNCPFGLFYELKSLKHRQEWMDGTIPCQSRSDECNASCSYRDRWLHVYVTYLGQHLNRSVSATMTYEPKKWQTLFGAIPALTVSLVSRNTSSLIWLTHSSAVRERSSQYRVMLILHEERKWQRSFKLTWDILRHTPQDTCLNHIDGKSPLSLLIPPYTWRNDLARK